MNWFSSLFRKSEGKNTGVRGEDFAAAKVRERGYQILERNWRCRLGEIDIVCRSGDTLVFVEVKSSLRRGLYSPETRVGRRKKLKLVQLGKYYVKQHKLDMPVQFDVVSVWWVDGKPQSEQFENAFSI